MNPFKPLSLLLLGNFLFSAEAIARPSIPPSEPPICDIPDEQNPPAGCIIVQYPTRNCPDILPNDPNDQISSSEKSVSPPPPEFIGVCGNSGSPIAAYFECTVNSDDIIVCEAFPTAIAGGYFSWETTGAVYSTAAQEVGTVSTFACEPLHNTNEAQLPGSVYATGDIRLNLLNPWTGLVTTKSITVACIDDSNEIPETYD